MADIPVPLTYGKIKWDVAAISGDSADIGEAPDVYTVSGTVQLIPSFVLANGVGVDPPKSFVIRAMSCSIQNGVLLGQDGGPDVSALAFDSPGLTPSYLQWIVNITLNEVGIVIPPFRINVLAGDTINLANYVPVDVVNAVVKVVSDETRVAAEAAAAEATTAAAEASDLVSGLLQISDAPTPVGFNSTHASMVDSITLEPDDTVQEDHWLRAVISMTVTPAMGSPVITPPPLWEVLAINRLAFTHTYILRHKRLVTDTSYTFSVNTAVNISASLDWIRGAGDEWNIGPVYTRPAASPSSNIAPPVVATKANNLLSTFAVENTAAAEADISNITGAAKWYFIPQLGASTATILVASDFQNLAGPSEEVWINYPNPGAGEGFAVQIAIPGAPNYNVNDPWGRTLVYVEKEGVPIPPLPAGTPVITLEGTVGGSIPAGLGHLRVATESTTLVPSDAMGTVIFNPANDCELLIPSDVFDDGITVYILNVGTAFVSIVDATVSPNVTYASLDQNQTAKLTILGTNNWFLEPGGTGLVGPPGPAGPPGPPGTGGTGTGAVSSVAGKIGDVTLTKSDIGGLEYVDNTADIDKELSSDAIAALRAKITWVGWVVGTGWPTYDTSPTIVRFFLSTNDVDATAPTYYSAYDQWYKHKNAP